MIIRYRRTAFMDYLYAKEYLKSIGQSQLLKYYDELDEDERVQLLKDIERTDFGVLENIGAERAPLGKIEPIAPLGLEESARRREEFENKGLQLISEGKVAAVLLAGGQGTRLGFDKPKGMFNMGENKFLSIFELHIKDLCGVAEAAGRFCPLYIMTSETNNDDTVKFFKENAYFGYPEDKIHFFIQDVAPTCDFDGKVFLDEKHRVSLAPNGNGGWYKSLVSHGLDKVLKKEGAEWINVCGVDNVLQRICDPVFVGATVCGGYVSGTKIVRKERPDENVGLLCKVNGRPSVIEYYEMDDSLKNLSKDGKLVYCNGIILNYLFNISALDRAATEKFPYHLAVKKIAHVENGERIKPEAPCGYKFETLVVDMVAAMENCLPFEVSRKSEFAPVKNAVGNDSVDTARALLKENGFLL